VGKENVEVDKFRVVGDDGGGDGAAAINHRDCRCCKKGVRTYQDIQGTYIAYR
jgi:hypothetical protein